MRDSDVQHCLQKVQNFVRVCLVTHIVGAHK